MANIRKIKPEESESVKNLIDCIMNGEYPAESSLYEYQDLDDLPAHYGGDREIFLVAEKDGKIVGTVAIKEDGPDAALLRRVFVHPDYRGKGYGAKLIGRAMEFCFEHKYKNVTFRGTDRMQNAVNLCLRNGFSKNDISELGNFQLIVLSKDL